MNKIENLEKSENNNNMDYSLYSSQPENLILLSQEELAKKNFDKNIDILKNSIIFAEKKYGGENEIELVILYNKYADGLLQKLTFLQKEKEESSKINEETNLNNKEEKTYLDNIFEYLNKANLILNKYLEKFKDKDPNTLDQKIIKYFSYLSYNYYLFATLEKIHLNNQKTIEYYELSIDYAQKYGNKFSRNLAALYFELVQLLEFDPFNCLLFLYKIKVIMEYHLQKEITNAKLKIKLDIDEKDLELNNISYKSDKIFKNKKIIETNIELNKEMETNLNIKEFVDIIKNTDNHIKNVISELKEYINHQKNKEQNEKGENDNGNIIKDENEDLFNDNIEKKKNIFMFVNYKRNEPSNNDEDIKKIEEDYSKKKYI